MNRPFRTAATHASDVEGRRGHDPRIDSSVEDRRYRASIDGIERRQLRKTKIAIAVCLILVLSAVVYFFVVPSTVPHYAVTPGSVVVEMTGPGILDATNKVTITSRIPGFLNSISVDRNDLVTAGQALAELDAKDIESELEGALADVDVAKSAVVEAIGNRAKAKAALDKANSDLVRRRGLSTSGIVSRVEVDTLEIAVQQATAEYDRSAAVEEGASARVRVASAKVGVLQHKRNEAQILSPLKGVVVSRDRNVGDLLTAGIQLFQLVDPKSIVISTRLDESIMGLIEPGQSAKVRFTSDPIQAINAKVVRISRTVDPETREFMIELSPDGLPRNWALGQRAFVAIDVVLPPETLVVPLAFVARRDGRAGVWRRVLGRAIWAPIEAGAVSGKYLQMLHGVAPGDVVLDPRGRYTFEAVAIEGSLK
jgi:HlyD family secretion protein